MELFWLCVIFSGEVRLKNPGSTSATASLMVQDWTEADFKELYVSAPHQTCTVILWSRAFTVTSVQRLPLMLLYRVGGVGGLPGALGQRR